ASSKTEKTAPAKIAVVDIQKVFHEYEKTRVLEIKLNQQNEVFGEYSDQLKAQYLSLKKEYDSSLADSQNVVYSTEERERKRLKSVELKDALARKEQESKSYIENSVLRLQEMEEKLRGEVVEDIKKAVHNIAVLEGYTLVLDKSDNPLTGIGFVIYAQPNLDITETAIQNLNRGYHKDAKNPAAQMRGRNNHTDKSLTSVQTSFINSNEKGVHYHERRPQKRPQNGQKLPAHLFLQMD
ncbi:MAG: OmpH family outer membrane protein, partial [Treponema sp.]|nr:OmpH family outer membrane protein [Treponema sp.]